MEKRPNGIIHWDSKNEGLNNNNFKNNRTPSALTEPFLKYSKQNYTHTHTLSFIFADKIQETATFLHLILFCLAACGNMYEFL